jgi:glycine/D-amino acid oxidase-like deaminating enzyme
VTRSADVVIIGGGITGVSIAWNLARTGIRDVLVLERRFLAAGGTGRSVGIVRQLYPTRETTQMVVRALATFRDFDAIVGGSASYVRSGVLIGVSPPMRPALERTLAIQSAVGVRAELLEPNDVDRIEPRIDTSGLGAVLWEPDSGYGDPTAVTLAYADAARRLGVTIEQDTEVVAIDSDERGVTGVRTARGDEFATRVVVNAAGLWSPQVATLAGVTLPIIVGRHPVFVVERGAAFGSEHPVYLDLAGGSYVRPETGGLTLTGSLTDDETKHPMDPDLLGAEPGLDEATTVLERTSRALPALGDATYRRGWAGAFDITPDWMPILDETEVPGFYVATGMSGHGFKLAPAVGEMMAARINGVPSPVALGPFRIDRFIARDASGSFVTSYLG